MPAYMTRKTYERLQEELRRLRGTEIPRISREKQEAAEQGDLRENAGYDAAKERLEHLHIRVREIEERCHGVQFLDDLAISADRVSIGVRVCFLDLERDQEETLAILGPEDADVEAGIISFQSPVARGMIARQVGDEVEIKVPDGVRRLKILAVCKFNQGEDEN